MKLLFVIGLALFARSNAFPTPKNEVPKQCADPTFACQDLNNARACGVVKDCINDIWATMNVPDDNDEVCDICKEMVKEARDQLLSNMTQEELKEVFEGSCELMGVKPIVAVCKKLVDSFIPELVEFCASRMDPNMVCHVSGMCFVSGKKAVEIFPVNLSLSHEVMDMNGYNEGCGSNGNQCDISGGSLNSVIIRGDSSNNRVVITGGSINKVFISGGHGSYLTIRGGSTNQISISEGGDNHVSISGGSGSKVDISEGHENRIGINGGSVNYVTIRGSSGRNVGINGESGRKIVISRRSVMNTSINRMILPVNLSLSPEVMDTNGYNEGCGSNGNRCDITGGSGSNVIIRGDSRNNHVVVTGGSNNKVFISGGHGNNFIIRGGSGNQIYISEGGDNHVTITGGSGSKVDISEGHKNRVSINGGSGSKVDISEGHENRVGINGGSANYVTITGSSGRNVGINGGSGRNIVIGRRRVMNTSINRNAFQKYVKMVLDAKTPDECKQCTTLVVDLQTFMKSSSETDDKKFIEKICSEKIPSYLCDIFVSEYFKTFYSYIISTDATALCSSAGICPKKRCLVDDSPKVKDDLTCEFCEHVLQHVKDLVTANTTAEEFRTALLNFCKHTGNFAEKCTSMVNDYYDMLFDYIRKVDTKGMCTLMGLCTDEACVRSPLIKVFPAGEPRRKVPLIKLLPANPVIQNSVPLIKLLPADVPSKKNQIETNDIFRKK